MNNIPIIFRNLGLLPWDKVFNKMSYFTNNRDNNTIDEIWFVEHYSVFTKGQIENKKKILVIENIPVMQSDRGGKITYHGPGQQLVYLLIDLKRFCINIRKLLSLIENIVLSTLNYFSIIGHFNKKYPGIYVNNKKICSIGLKIKKHYCFHGFALNVKMNLKPFTYIKPCGMKNIKMTQMSDIKNNITLNIVRKILIKNCLFFLKKQ